jgi:hypothetical protein
VVRVDANADFKYTDTPAIAMMMVMASASPDLDNDWKDEVVKQFGYEGGPLHASFTWVGADGEPTTSVVRDLAVGGSAVVLGEGEHIEMATGDFDNDGYPSWPLASSTPAAWAASCACSCGICAWSRRRCGAALWPRPTCRT